MLQDIPHAPVALVIFIITLATSFMAFRDSTLKNKLIFNPVLVSDRKEYYRLLTSGLIHGDQYHLIFNMLAYFFFAFKVEILIGHWQFAFLYIACLLIADIPTLIRQEGNIIYRTLGASGAISGVLMAFILFEPGAGMTFIIFPFFSFPAWLLGLGFLAYSFYATFSGRHSKINHDAHLWGALAGLVFTVILAPEAAQILVDYIGSAFE